MATMHDGPVTIDYAVDGEGFPVLLLAPGGMKSERSRWSHALWNPYERLSTYQLIGMDQRNAGRSTAPISAADQWSDYTNDQLRLLDHLGVEQCHLIGMCIGGPFILALLTAAPQRFRAAVVIQPVGRDGNRDLLFEKFDEWADDLKPARPTISADDLGPMRENLWGPEGLLTVTEAEVAEIKNPMLILIGDDQFHTVKTSRTIAAAAGHARLIESWKDPAELAATDSAIQAFLAEHTPATW
jgi:pimeloyl-ACP methyl ester carboxylesterase